MKKTKYVGASIACPHIEETAEYNIEAVTLKSAQKERGITLIALIITIIVMLILVAVSIQVALNTGLFESAGKATQGWKTEQKAEQELAGGQVNIGGTTYNSIDEYMQSICLHEWGEWEVNPSAGEQTRTCTKCGKKESTEIIIGAYIEGYDPSVAEDGSRIETSYESAGAQSGGTETTDGTSGNGYGDQTFTVGSITKWRVLGEQNGQVIITPADPIQTDAETNYYLGGQAGYANMIEELNKISGIYGQGKYADTSKYSYTIDGTTIASGGRSARIEDTGGYGYLTRNTKGYKTGADGKALKDDGTSYGKTFTYWGEDDTNSETGAEWYILEENESVKMVQYKIIVRGDDMTKIRVLGKNSSGSSVYSWLANRYVNFGSGMVLFNVPKVSGQNVYYDNSLFYSYGFTSSSGSSVRPVVYLKSDIQLEYNPETGYTIIP